MGRNCYYDASNCLVCPEIAAEPAVPTRYDYVPSIGWNAGANTVVQLDGDLHAKLQLPAGVVGAVIGIRHGRASQIVPALVEHGFYFSRAAGHDLWQVIERGATVGSTTLRAATDTFEIRRVLGQVTYRVNDVLVHTSAKASTGVVVLNACLYSSGDQVGA